MIIEKTDSELGKILQSTVIFEVNKKALREGKLILYNIKDFYITFNILTSKGIMKTYELPVPFNIYSDKNNNVIFDYDIDYISRKDRVIEYLITIVGNKFNKKSKLFNNKLTIKVID